MFMFFRQADFQNLEPSPLNEAFEFIVQYVGSVSHQFDILNDKKMK